MFWKQPFVMSQITMTDTSPGLALAASCLVWSHSKNPKGPKTHSIAAILGISVGGCKQGANMLWRLLAK